MRARFASAALAGALVSALAARGAAAAPADFGAPQAAPASTPWSIDMVGGVEQPIGTTKESHQRGLEAGVRLAWTSSVGLGIEAAVDYSPLPHVPDPDGTRFDTTFATAAIGPRFAAGWSRFGFALEAGGGVAMDHTTAAIGTSSPQTLTTTTDVAPAVEAGVEIEVTVVSGGGIVLTGGGTRAFGSLGYEMAWAMGGLALSF